MILFLTLLGNSQQKIRTVEKGVSFPNQPIEIVGRELAGEPFIDDTRVLGDQDWLKHLTLSVKNVSNKNIMSFDIDILIKKEGKTLMGIPISFRTFFRPDDTSSSTPNGEKKLGFLLPGEVVKVRVLGHVMSLFGKELVKFELENIDRVTLDIRAVYFDDKSRWMFGQESRPDPHNPSKRIRIDKPQPRVSKRVSDWLEYLLPVDMNYSSFSFLFIIPAGGRNFFTLTSGSIPFPPPPPTCVWLINEELITDTCSGFSTRYGCEGDDQSCIFEDFETSVRTSDPGTEASKGYITPEPYACKTNPELTAPPLCSTCDIEPRNVFRVETQCGTPGTCGQSANWGCAEGFVEIDGVCKRSVEYQNQCLPPSGYDSGTCSCPDGQATPTPTPSPTPAPTPWGVCLPDPDNYHLCHGSTCTLEMNTCNT